VNSTAHYFIPRGNCACVLSMDLGVKGSVLTANFNNEIEYSADADSLLLTNNASCV